MFVFNFFIWFFLTGTCQSYYLYTSSNWALVTIEESVRKGIEKGKENKNEEMEWQMPRHERVAIMPHCKKYWQKYLLTKRLSFDLEGI